MNASNEYENNLRKVTQPIYEGEVPPHVGQAIHQKPSNDLTKKLIQPTDQEHLEPAIPQSTLKPSKRMREQCQQFINKLSAAGLKKSIHKVTKNLCQNSQEIEEKTTDSINNLHQIGKEPGFATKLLHKISSLIDHIKPQMHEEVDSTIELHSTSKKEIKKRDKLRRQQQLDRSSPLSYTYTSKGKVYGTAIATAIPTKDFSINSLSLTLSALDKKLALINEKLHSTESSDTIQKKPMTEIQQRLFKEKELITREKSFVEKALIWTARKDRGNYIPTNEIRTLFGTEEGKDLFPIEPVNYYKQEMRTAQGDTLASLRRFAVICDWRYGLTNLTEMREALKNNTFQNIYKQLEELLDDTNLTIEQKKAIEGTMKLFSSKEDLEMAIHERTFILKQQALPVVCDHIRDRATKIQTDKEKVAFIHESLLNPSTKKLDKNGVGLFEECKMIDMKEALNLLAGSEITFTDDPNITEPFFDSDGSIKMPRPQGVPKEISSVTARPIFFNISVQGHKQEDLDTQRKINNESLGILRGVMERKLKDKSPAERNYIRALYQKCHQMNIHQKSSYKMAENITELALLLDIPLSLNCLSAKDRTGYVAERTLVRYLQQQIRNEIPDEKQAKNLIDDFGSRGFDNTTIAAQIVAINTDVSCLKVSPLLPPGINNLQSFLQRIRSGSQGLYYTPLLIEDSSIKGL